MAESREWRAEREEGRGEKGDGKVRSAKCKVRIGRRDAEYAVRSRQYAVRRTRPSSFILHPSGARRGVSLLEVLVSMFIILFGLLGVAALLEVGRSESGVATRHDRALACGRSGLAEVRLRRMHDPNNWLALYDANNPYPGWAGTPPPPNWYAVPTYESNLEHYQVYAIDPLYIARFSSENPGATPAQIAFNTARFPYGAGAPLWMGRCSLSGVSVGQSFPGFDRLFTWPDDQVFDLPKDPQQRPTRQLDALGVGQFEGNYSWLATICPAPTEAGLVTANKTHFEVSVVVFYQRDFTPPMAAADPNKPGERWLTVFFAGAGVDGGDVVLQKGPADPPDWLDVRENDWIFLGGWQTATDFTPSMRKIFKWYRVIAVESQNPNTPNVRRATLTGQDWSPNWRADTNADGSISALDGSMGVVCSGVVDVYTQLMELD